MARPGAVDARAGTTYNLSLEVSHPELDDRT